MTNDELLVLLRRARAVLDHYMFDEAEMLRDDIAEVCMAIDDALPDATRVEVKRVGLEHTPQRSAA